MKRVAALVATLLFAAGGGAAAVEVPQVDADEPRAFGWQVGDVVAHRVTLRLPRGWVLDERSAPRPGQRGRAVELRRVARAEHADDGGTRIDFDLEYQVMLAPATLRTVEVAPWRLRVEGAGRSEELRVEALPLAVAPLVFAEPLARRGLDELQPDRPAPAVDTRPLRARLALWAALALVPLGLLAAVHIGVPWQAARRRPFGQAWRALRRSARGGAGGGDATRARWREASRVLHRALDRAAGETVFAAGLARFVAAQPHFAPLRADLERFLAQSHAEFFGAGAAEPPELDALVALARRLRDAERGGR